MNAQRSVERAVSLLDADPSDEYLIVKLLPEPLACCCSGCWPRTWHMVNDAIVPASPIPHEGDSLLSLAGHPVILESHESGPEIVMLMAQWAKSITALLKPVSEIVTTFVKALGHERPKGLGKLRVESYRVRNGVETRLATLDLEFPLDEETLGKLNSSVQELLEEGTTEQPN